MFERAESSGGHHHHHSSSSARPHYFVECVRPASVDYYNCATSSISSGGSGGSDANSSGTNSKMSTTTSTSTSSTLEDETILTEALLLGGSSSPVATQQQAISEEKSKAKEQVQEVQEVPMQSITLAPAPAISTTSSARVVPSITYNDPAAVAAFGQDTSSWDTVLQQHTTVGSSKRAASPAITVEPPRKKPCKNNNSNTNSTHYTRTEKNAREKQRSLSIATQISEIGKLVTAAAATGDNNIVSLHRGTKSEVLSEAVKYIRLLQERLRTVDKERTKLWQVVQEIGAAGSHSRSAATAVRTAVAQQGIWSLSGFEGAPPKTEGSIYYNGGGCVVSDGSSSTTSSSITTTVKEAMAGGINYQLVFQACPVGMAIASLGGQFVDCNQEFCEHIKGTKEDVCAMSFFHLIHEEDLQTAFDAISELVSSCETLNVRSDDVVKPCIVRVRIHQELRLRIELITGSDGTVQSFCVTLLAAEPTRPSEPLHNRSTTGSQATTTTQLPMFPSLSAAGSGVVDANEIPNLPLSIDQ